MIKQLLTYCCLLFLWQTNYAQDLNVSLIKTEQECVSAKASVTINSAALPYHVQWSNGAITDEVSDLNPGDYSVYIKDDHNKDTTIFFKIDELVCEPTAGIYFSPNGDLINDTWHINRLHYFPDFELFVYNRWGQQVHHQAGTYIPWDGTNLGSTLPDGAYYYILYLSKSNKHKFIKGDVSIIR